MQKKRALVFGLGKSGLSASKYLHKLGYEVFGIDDKKKEIFDFYQLTSLLTPEFLQTIDLAVFSPGIPLSHPNISLMQKYCKEVEGEAELGLKEIRKDKKVKIIGITGTKGKTTLTSFMAHVLNGTALGNVGFPFTEYLYLEKKDSFIAAELSSFQIESLKSICLDHAVITNISPDHLDRYRDCKEYAFTKLQMAKCIKSGGTLILPKALFEEFSSFLKPFSLEILFVEDLITSFKKSALYEKIVSSYKEKFLGAEMLALAFAFTKEVGEEAFFSSIASFQKPLHRLEFVAKIDGVEFINDSKATNVESVLYGVRQVPNCKHLIMGGSDKGFDFSLLQELSQEKVKKVYLIGECAKKIQIALQEKIPTSLYSCLEEAVHAAFSFATPNESVILSPACASYDQFASYEHRGDAFKQIVKQLEKKGKNQ